MLNEKSLHRVQILQSHLVSNNNKQPQHGASFFSTASCSAEQKLPKTYKQVVITKKSSNYREAAQIKEVALELPKANQVLVKNLFAGVQASDIMISNGVYGPLRTSEPPMVGGNEAAGVVMAVGENVKNLKVGQHVVFSQFGHGFTEFTNIDSKFVFPVPKASPEAVSILISGLTALLAFHENGIDVLNNKKYPGKIMLVTAASGATGSFAVQLAKRAGLHVIGTCGGEEKAKVLKQLGCDRVVNYKTEDLGQILKKEYPKGVDYVYEGVGRSMFNTCMKHLAPYGTMMIIGMITDYKGEAPSSAGDMPKINFTQLLFTNQKVVGFFLLTSMNRNPKEAYQGIQLLFRLWQQQEIKIIVEKTSFKGVESVFEAIDYLHNGNNTGKVFITL